MAYLRRISVLWALILAWGLAFPISKVALGYMPPLFLAGSRYLLAGLCLLGVALARREPINFRESWFIILLSALFNVIISNTLATVAVDYLGADIAVTLVYLQPILVAVLAWLWLHEPLSLSKMLALILGFAGVITIGIASVFTNIALWGIMVGIASAAAWALGTVCLKRFHKAVSSYWLIALQFLVSSAVVLVTSRLVERWSAVHWTIPSELSLAYLSLGALAFAWILWLRLIAIGEVSRISALIFYVPVVSVALAALALHEVPSGVTLLGILAIILSVNLVNRKSFFVQAEVE